METFTYFADGFSSIEEVEEAYGTLLDASTLQKVADCPRAHQIRVEENLDRPSPTTPMVAGIAVHYGLEYYYANSEPTDKHEAEAIRLMEVEYATFDIDRVNQDTRYLHLQPDHLADVMRNYFNTWNRQRIEVYRPYGGLKVDELDLSSVVAAQFYLTPDEDIILGESKLVMKFDVEGEELVLAGKPDLPVRKQDGSIYIMDHKSTSAYLSDYWAKSHEVSNKMRGYMAMVSSLLGGEPLAGAVINGLYVGKHALSETSKATKFQRFQYDFTPDHVTESLRNQLAWRKTIDHYREEGYFPQGCAYGGCSYPDVCKRDPASRAVVKEQNFVPSTRTFWGL